MLMQPRPPRNIPGLSSDYIATWNGDIYKRTTQIQDETVYERIPVRDDGRGYLCCDVVDWEGWTVTRKVHRLVYAAWGGHIPDGAHIDHIDGNKQNNSPANLRLLDHSTNSAGGRKTSRRGAVHLTDAQKLMMRAAFAFNLPTKQIADTLGIGLTTVRRYRRAFKRVSEGA